MALTAAEKMAAFRQRKRDSGYIQRRIWVKATGKDPIALLREIVEYANMNAMSEAVYENLRRKLKKLSAMLDGPDA